MTLQDWEETPVFTDVPGPTNDRSKGRTVKDFRVQEMRCSVTGHCNSNQNDGTGKQNEGDCWSELWQLFDRILNYPARNKLVMSDR